MGKPYLIKAVSIHAPTRGATTNAHKTCKSAVVSIHAPTRGATGKADCKSFTYAGFNPRPHAGGDVCVAGLLCVCTCFNPRPHAGGDSTAKGCKQPFTVFQSTPPRGGRLHNFCLCSDTPCFNPRPHAGGDSESSRNWSNLLVSIHAPTRGATP